MGQKPCLRSYSPALSLALKNDMLQQCERTRVDHHIVVSILDDVFIHVETFQHRRSVLSFEANLSCVIPKSSPPTLQIIVAERSK